MLPLDRAFSPGRIVNLLVRQRLRTARKRRNSAFILGLGGESLKLNSKFTRLEDLLPPRNKWSKYRPHKHERINNTTQSGPDLVAHCLARGVIAELKRPRYRWAHRLAKYINDIRHRALNWSRLDPFAPESIHCLPKNKPGNGQKYRVVASYSLDDTIIASGYAAHIRSLLDQELSPACLAFRGRRSNFITSSTTDSRYVTSSMSMDSAPTHHDAVELIDKYRKQQHAYAKIWVSECDIRGFFDSVSHSIAHKSINDMFQRADVVVDPRAENFLMSFFAGYNFDNLAKPIAVNQLRQQGITKPVLADPTSWIRAHGITATKSDRGVPQGSAISCLIANAVLSEADSVVMSIISQQGLYLRYCDDIVILETQRATCAHALDAYLSVLDKLELPYHLPETVTRYDRSFWRGKSKKPYVWASKSDGRAVPWFAFVGYEMRRSGRIRPRRSSVEKELSSQFSSSSRFFARIESKKQTTTACVVRPLHEIEERVRDHLAAHGVGYPRVGTVRPAPDGVSWSAGFRALRGRTLDDSGLRKLDAGRTKTMKALRKRLYKMESSGRIQFAENIRKRGPALTRSQKRLWRIRYLGPNFSYRNQY
ncbi:hypothetical protein DB30_05686 [Enhygromyxa salina]|uniref:Reverse transcriptase domain-containing protein n=1 Tax=Enhygromyxa salina TaxID=215803 RepID=A0A0C1ZCE0_9BACT|nr:hypothetical protein DB30_05686 [Enhygromyxa salina]